MNRDSLVEARARSEAEAEAEATPAAFGFGFGGNGGGVGEEKEEDRSALLAHLRFGADAVAMASGANEPLDDATLDAIVDRTRTGNEALPTLKRDKKNTATFDAEKAETGTRELQGVTYERPKAVARLGDISQEWAELVEGKKRKRQARVTMIEGKGTGYGSAAVPVLRDVSSALLGLVHVLVGNVIPWRPVQSSLTRPHATHTHTERIRPGGGRGVRLPARAQGPLGPGQLPRRQAVQAHGRAGLHARRLLVRRPTPRGCVGVDWMDVWWPFGL